METTPFKIDLSEISIKDLDISLKALDKLTKAKLLTLADIAAHTESEIAYLLNKKSFYEIVAEMKKYKASFNPLY